MAQAYKGRPGLDMESWLARKIKLGNLHELPPFYANGGGSIYQAEPYARLLLSAIREVTCDIRTRERAQDDARAFRSWVEGNQLDLTPAWHLPSPWTNTARA